MMMNPLLLPNILQQRCDTFDISGRIHSDRFLRELDDLNRNPVLKKAELFQTLAEFEWRKASEKRSGRGSPHGRHKSPGA